MPHITSLKLQGYRPFGDFLAHFDPLEVLVGANGAGKSALFEFLKFLRDGMYSDIPPEIVPGSIGQQIFHIPGPERFWWSVEIEWGWEYPLAYQGQLLGPIGRPQVTEEHVGKPATNMVIVPFLDMQGGQGVAYEEHDETGAAYDDIEVAQHPIRTSRPNQLALSTIVNPTLKTLYSLREYIRDWRFYGALTVSKDKIRRAVLTEQQPALQEDCGNLSAVLHYLMTEHSALFEELQQHLRLIVPGFKRLNVKARGGPGEVIAFWQENGVDQDLSLADLSDGILRLLCWTVLCLHPNPPTLICIDEPDQGVHPRTLPLLAGLFQKASQRTQILLATHNSYFLTQFELEQIAVMRKERGEAQFIKPNDSQVLVDILDDFGPDELENLHRSDELERLP